MSDLREFAALQARVYEFLGQQDERALRAIVDGSLRLAVLRADDLRAPTDPAPRDAAHTPPPPETAGRTRAQPADPSQVAQHLPTLTSEQDRRTYLDRVGSVSELQAVAKLLGLRRYSKLKRSDLLDLITRHPADPSGEPSPLWTPPPANDAAPTGQPATAQPSPETARPHMATVAARLRELATEDEGAAYLREQRLSREDLLALASALQLTRVERLSQKELTRRVLKQAIGARRKFAGLRSW